MKCIWIICGLATAVILVHGTITYRANYQIAFAQAVEKKIDIASIHVQAVSGTLVLTGKGTKEQADYAENIARMYVSKYSKRAVNPPTDVRNEVEIGSVVGAHHPSDPRAPAATH